MTRERPKITDWDISFRSRSQLDYIKHILQRAKNIQEDPDKKERLQANECLICWYRGGAMVTNASVFTNCKSCNKNLQFSNSDIDEICIDCAKEHKLCKHCGADIEYKERRKPRIFNFKIAETGDLSKEDLRALRKKFDIEQYKEHYIDLKMNFSNCCQASIIEETDICSKCKEHCEPETLI